MTTEIEVKKDKTAPSQTTFFILWRNREIGRVVYNTDTERVSIEHDSDLEVNCQRLIYQIADFIRDS